MVNKFKILTFLFLVSCSTGYKRVAIVHEYIIYAAIQKCASHQGLHYIVPYEYIKSVSSSEMDHDFPCEGKYMIRCQDDSLFKIESEVQYCFISEHQIYESLHPEKQ